MTAPGSAETRVRRLIAAARRIADPSDALGREALAVLPAATGLSPEGVALALEQCLETDPTDAEMASLLGSVRAAPRAHVLLSANVFVAAHRAIALALAASEEVHVRPSRREPEMVRLLAEGAPGLFRVVSALAPEAGDHAFLYGSDETITAVRGDLGADVTVHAHGAGLGVVVVDVDDGALDSAKVAAAIAEDVVLFDQRGCLSPRVVLAVGAPARARVLAEALAVALEHAEERVPRGRLDAEELGAVARYRDTLRYAGELLPAGSGYVGLDVVCGPIVVPPVGRHVHVLATADLARSATPLAGLVVAVATVGSPDLAQVARACFPGARESLVGRMQRPPLDGPVDRRARA